MKILRMLTLTTLVASTNITIMGKQDTKLETCEQQVRHHPHHCHHSHIDCPDESILDEILEAFANLVCELHNHHTHLPHQGELTLSEAMVAVTSVINNVATVVENNVITQNASTTLHNVIEVVHEAIRIKRIPGDITLREIVSLVEAADKPMLDLRTSTCTSDCVNKELCQPRDRERIQAILNTFMHMVGNFANILAEPRNMEIVSSSAAHMVAGIIDIALTAMNGNARDQKTLQTINDLKALKHNAEFETLIRTHMLKQVAAMQNKKCQ